jgi:predicted RNA-binding Zn ribbon-like protein
MTDAAPGQLELVRDFVNTLDFDDEIERFDSPDALSAWLSERDLLPEGARVGPAALRRAIELREALRRLLLANNGGPSDPDAVATLNRAVADADLSIRFDSAGRPALAVTGTGPVAPVAPIVAIVYEAMVNDTWPRLKACRADDCQWAFYDASRNRSGAWCDMAVCGNRAKVRAYRERHAPSDGASGS